MTRKKTNRRPNKIQDVEQKKTAPKKVNQTKEKFLNAYLESEGSITLAAEEVGIDRRTHYDWLKNDPEYEAKFKIYQQAIEDREKQIFLLAYAKNMSISKAAELVGFDRGKHYEWMKDEKYARQFREIKSRLADVLEEEAFRRAVEGTDEPVFYEGTICGYVRKYSDSLLSKLLQAFIPEKYRDKSDVNINNHNQIINVQLADAIGVARERLRNVQRNIPNIPNGTGTGE